MGNKSTKINSNSAEFEWAKLAEFEYQTERNTKTDQIISISTDEFVKVSRDTREPPQIYNINTDTWKENRMLLPTTIRRHPQSFAYDTDSKMTIVKRKKESLKNLNFSLSLALISQHNTQRFVLFFILFPLPNNINISVCEF